MDTREPGATGDRILRIISEIPGAGAIGKAVLAVTDKAEAEARAKHVDEKHDEMVALLGYIATEVGRRDLQNALAEEGVAEVEADDVADALFGAAYRDYFSRSHEYLYSQFRGIRQLDTLVDLKLEDIYVKLEAAPEAVAAPRSDEQELRDKLTDDDVPADEREALETELHELRRERAPDARPRPTDEVLRDHARLVVLGDPGSGKSTLVNYLAQTFARGPDVATARLGLSEDRLPIVVRIGAFAGAVHERGNEYRLCDFIRDRADADHGDGMGDFLLRAMQRGECVLLLDGLDEIPASGDRVRVSVLINHFLARPEFADNRVMVTSRLYGYPIARLHGLPHFVLAPFGRDQIEAFAHHWCTALDGALHPDSPDPDRARREADDLTQAIFGRPDVESFAQNPLMLTLLALIRRRGVPLPERRVELYELALRTLIETWNEGREALAGVAAGEKLDYQETVRVWAPVALWMHEHFPTGGVHRAQLLRRLAKELEGRGLSDEQAETTAESYIETAARQVGVLAARGADTFAFLHQTFQEYLAAQALTRPASTLPARIAARLPDPRWRDVLLLCMGFVGVVRRDEEKVTDILEDLLANPDEWEPLLFRRLRFAAECLADQVNMHPSLEQRILLAALNARRSTPIEALRTDLHRALIGLDHVEPREDARQAALDALRDSAWETRELAARLLGHVRSQPQNTTRALRAHLDGEDDPDVRLECWLGIIGLADFRHDDTASFAAPFRGALEDRQRSAITRRRPDRRAGGR